jgi:hypothetical protein
MSYPQLQCPVAAPQHGSSYVLHTTAASCVCTTSRILLCPTRTCSVLCLHHVTDPPMSYTQLQCPVSALRHGSSCVLHVTAVSCVCTTSRIFLSYTQLLCPVSAPRHGSSYVLHATAVSCVCSTSRILLCPTHNYNGKAKQTDNIASGPHVDSTDIRELVASHQKAQEDFPNTREFITFVGLLRSSVFPYDFSLRFMD